MSSDDDEGHIELDSSDDEAPPRADKAADERPMSERVRESRRQRRAARQARAEAPASDEDGEAPPAPAPTEAPDTFSELATTKILTPADFAKLNELRLAAAEEKAKEGGAAGAQARRELAALQLQKKRTSGTGEVVDESDILGPRKKAKADYEERMASIQSGREGRDKFGSRKGKKNKEVASSSTNRQKARGKNFQMVAHSWGVRSKKKASLREKSKRLRKHVTQAKKRLK